MIPRWRRFALLTAAVSVAVSWAGCSGGGQFGGARDPVNVSILCAFAGASPIELEELVVLPLETAIQGLPNVQRIRAVCREGRAIVCVEFDPGVAPLAARQAIAQRLEPIEGQLPDGATVTIAPDWSLSDEIVLVAMRSATNDETNGQPPGIAVEMRELAELKLRPSLLRIPGVQEVTVLGGMRRELQVLVDRDRMAALDVTFDDLEDAIRRATAAAPPNVAPRHEEVLIRRQGSVESLDEMADVVIVARDGVPVRIKDVADVRELIVPEVKPEPVMPQPESPLQRRPIRCRQSVSFSESRFGCTLTTIRPRIFMRTTGNLPPRSRSIRST